MQVDFGRTSSDYAKHRAGFPDVFFSRLVREGILRPGLRAVDVGTGTGTIARGLARHGCTVTALDVSAPMLESARGLATEAGLRIDFHQGSAERTGLPSESCELVTAGQCWHWFDRRSAAREAARLLVPGGRLVIAHNDWLAPEGSVVEATETLIEAFNPGPPPTYLGYGHGVGVYPEWYRDVAGAGFTGVESFTFDVTVPYTHEAWRGRIRANARVGASLPAASVARFDTQLAAILAERFPQEPLSIPHRIFALVATRP